MRVDLLAGTVYRPAAMPEPCAPTILVFDSGLGGLTVLAEVVRARPDARFVYAADDAAFPYGRLSEEEVTARVLDVFERLVAAHRPDLAVVACNTASTVVLPHLRRRFTALPFVGTVPAIKPAAALSRSRRIAVLATPGTVARDYTRELVEAFAGDCRVTLVGSPNLAALCEAELAGAPADDAAILAEIAPCFVDDGRGTDVVVLACTHYPLLAARFAALAPWPVTWLDPAPAIARRVVQLIGPPTADAAADDTRMDAVFTGGTRLTASLRAALGQRGLKRLAIEALPLARA